MNSKSVLFLLSLLLLLSCNRSKPINTDELSSKSVSYLEYEESAMKVILQTKEILGKNLMEAMRSGGVEYAVSFCAERAQEITDSIGQLNDVSIRRVALKNRNSLNAADEGDLAYMSQVENLMKNGGTAVQAWTDKGESVIVRQPIFTEELCLNCHGRINETMLPENLAIIKKYYPEDKAIDFELQSLRGIWVVELKK